MPRVSAWLIALVSICGACGCQSPRLDATSDVAPADFGLALTVLSSADDTAVADLVHLRQCRIILEPDGSLRSSFDPSVSAATYPGLTRVLDREEVDAVWRLARDLGLIDPAAEDRVGNLTLVDPQPGQRTYLVALIADGQRLTYGRTHGIDEAPDEALVRLSRALAALSWATDEPPPGRGRAPRRYDFGPDPYARYRR